MTRTLAAMALSDRLRARLHALRLDGALAAREVHWDTPIEAARARQLLARRSRQELACGFERVLAHTVEAPRWSSEAPVAGAAVLACAHQIEMLVATLRAPGPVHPTGVARARLLLVDPASALREPTSCAALRRHLSAVYVALAPAGVASVAWDGPRPHPSAPLAVPRRGGKRR